MGGRQLVEIFFPNKKVCPLLLALFNHQSQSIIIVDEMLWQIEEILKVALNWAKKFEHDFTRVTVGLTISFDTLNISGVWRRIFWELMCNNGFLIMEFCWRKC